VLYFICGRRGFSTERPLAVHALHGLFFLQKFSPRKTAGSTQSPAAAKKSDKNLRPPENLVYYIQEMRKEKFPQYIRRIRRRVRSFLCFRPPLPLPAAGVLYFAAGEIRHTVHINIKKERKRKLMKLKKENGKTILVFENDETMQVYPNSVDYYEPFLVASALDITDFEVYDDNPKYISIDGIIYTKDGLMIVAVPCGKSGCIKIREGVEVIKDSAFDKSAASKVICPQSLRLIDKYAFRSSIYLTEIVLNEGLKKIGACAFYNCESLTTTTIPSSVDDIGSMAFESSPLTSLTFAPDRKKSLLIEPMAFEDCTAESLYLPGFVKVQDCNFRGVKSISLDGFSNLPDILRTCIVGIVNSDINRIGGAFQVNVDSQSYFFPRAMLIADRKKLLDDVAKVCFLSVLSFSLKAKKRMLKKIVNKAYQSSVFDVGCRVAVKTYGNMNQKERAKKDGKELAAYLHEKDAAILAMAVMNHDAELLKEYLDFGLSKPENIKKAFDLVNYDAAVCEYEIESAKSKLAAVFLRDMEMASHDSKNDDDTIIKAYLMQAMQMEEQDEFEI